MGAELGTKLTDGADDVLGLIEGKIVSMTRYSIRDFFMLNEVPPGPWSM